MALACAVAALLFGGHIAKQTDFTQPTGQTATVALAQGNIEQHLKFRNDQVLPTLDRYFRQIAATHADIVILPETAFPVMLQELPDNIIAEFAEQARQNGSALAVGTMQYTADGMNYQNAVVNLTDYRIGAANIPFYAKNHLVPFGEYKPLPSLTAPLYQMMDMPLSDILHGGEAQKPFPMKNQQVAFNICYEDGFGDDLIASAKQSTLLANASNLAWYGDSNAMFQHLQQSQARALELGRYMARATNTGATAIVDNKGRIVAMAPTNTATVLKEEIQGYQGETPYMRLGGSLPFIGLLSLFAAVFLAIGLKRSR